MSVGKYEYSPGQTISNTSHKSDDDDDDDDDNNNNNNNNNNKCYIFMP